MNTQKVTFRNADMAWDITALILLPEGLMNPNVTQP